MEQYNIGPDRIEIHAQAEVKRQRELIGRRLIKPGVALWECDLATGDVRKATIDVKLGLNGEVQREVIVKENCLYDFAINGENAVRKFVTRLKR